MPDNKNPDTFFQKLTKLFRYGPLVKRKLMAYDPTLALPASDGSSSRMLFQKSTNMNYTEALAGTYQYADRVARYQDFGEMEYCLSGDTRIPIPGGFKTLKELSDEYGTDKEFIVFSYDHNKRTLVSAKAKQARKTRTDESFKVKLSNGKEIIGSANHRLLLRNGIYCRIDQLKTNDSLMPFFDKSSRGQRSLYLPRPNKGNFWVKEKELLDNLSDDYQNNFKKTNTFGTIVEIYCNATQDKDQICHILDLTDEEFNSELKTAGYASFQTFERAYMIRSRKKTKRDSTIDDVYFSFRDNMNLNGLASTLINKKPTDVVSMLLNDGFNDPEELLDQFKYVTVESVEPNGVIDLYDLTVNGYKNFATDSVISHNTPEIAAALDIYADETCLAGNTVIPLLDGTKKTIKELFESKEKDFWLYSFDIQNSKFVPGLAKEVVKTGTKQLYKITFDDNTFVRLTDNHRVLLSNGEYKQVSELNVDTSISSMNVEKDKVISSIELDSVEDVYDLEVNDWHNFAISGDKEFNSYIIVHNCAQDDRGRSLHIHSNNLKIQNTLEELFYNTLNVEFNLRSWARSLAKYGDLFLYTDVSPKHGVVNTFPIPVAQLEREENFDAQDPFAVRFRWTTRGLKYLENWEVTHMRLLGNDMFLPYGASIIEPARRIWRQLCLAQGTDIWVKGVGYKKVEDILPNDIILSFNPETKELKEARVKKVKYMGKQKTVLVKTAHRQIKVTPNHGLLVKDKDGNFYYKKAEELITSNGKGGNSSKNADKLVLPSKWETQLNSYKVNLPENIYKGNKIYNSNRKSFLNSERVFETSKEFMRLFGFMFGDGWSVFESGKNYRTGFALGTDQEQNNFYISLFENLFPSLGKMKLTPPIENKRGGQVNFNSKELSCLFNEIGFKTGFNNKRVPNWVYELNVENKIEFIKGIFDADGSKSCGRLCLSNKELLEDIKILAQQSGVSVGSEIKIDRAAGKYKDSRFGNINRSTSYRLYLNLNNIESADFITENVCRITECGIDDTYDIEVDHENHNFTANGIISHNTLIEDAMLVYRLVRAPERRVFYVDVGNMPPENVSTYVEQLRKSMKTTQIVDKSSGKIDLRYNPQAIEEDFYIPVRGSDTGTKIESLAGGQNTSAVEDVEYLQKKLIAALKIPRAYLGYDEALACLTGDSKIKLLDGSSVSIEELATRKLNGNLDNVWVYSYDIENNKMVPGKVNNAWKTKEVNRLFHIKLDNGHVIKCTDNHPFLLRNGIYKRADELSINESLMPLYFKKSVSKKYNGSDLIDGYEMFLNNHTNEYSYTHKSVYESICGGNYNITKQRVIHHNDCNKLNNNPNNLMEMSWYEHRKWHSEKLETTLLRPDVVEKRKQILLNWLKSDKHRKFKSDMMKVATTTPGNIHYERIHSQEHANKMSNVLKNNWKNNVYRNIKTLQSKLNWTKESYKNKFVGDNHWSRKKNSSYDIEWLKDFCVKNNITSINQWRKDYANSVSNISPVGIRYVKSLILRSGFNSWKEFKSILNYNHKVISIEVIEYETPISVFDIEVDKWHNFLLDSGDDSGIFVHNSKSTLAQEDIRFSRTINVIQRTILAELNKLAVIHLFCLGFDGDDLMNFVLRLSNPSTIAQIQKIELWKSKFELASAAPEGMLSKTFVRKELIGLTETQIEEIDEQRITEKLKEAEIENAKSEEEEGGEEDSEETGEEGGESEEGGEEPSEEDTNKEVEDLFSAKDRNNILPITASKFARNNLLTSSGITDLTVDEILKKKEGRKRTPQQLAKKRIKHKKNKNYSLTGVRNLSKIKDIAAIDSIKNTAKTDMMIGNDLKDITKSLLLQSKESDSNEKIELSANMKNMLSRMNEKLLKRKINNILTENTNLNDTNNIEE
jgi:intein/homing endonuclease